MLNDLFEQYDYRIRWTFNEYREYWRCQLADAVSSRGHVWSHNRWRPLRSSCRVTQKYKGEI